MSSALIAGNIVTSIGTVTNPPKVSDLKIPGALTVENVNKPFVRARVFLIQTKKKA